MREARIDPATCCLHSCLLTNCASFFFAKYLCEIIINSLLCEIIKEIYVRKNTQVLGLDHTTMNSLTSQMTNCAASCLRNNETILRNYSFFRYL